ncbi:hypothetical protein [Humisphaera borealis]|uniref:Uncharacterized protein n=1 Tax=Humisphaera borealis TaxID=2807512 RepID=A0A7M2WS37_9BACT|nr:hypothetical protein [Humisphaera borealis]QOV87410.1 hypothetical protein IPV69_14030 [Humisphaera borealis]
MSSPIVPTPQDARLLLQDTVTKTATFNSTALDLGAGYAPGGPGRRMTALVAVVSRDTDDGNEAYTFTLQESSDNATFAACGVGTVAVSTGVTVVRGVSTKRYIRLVLTTSGTTPSITYKAWLNPLP